MTFNDYDNSHTISVELDKTIRQRLSEDPVPIKVAFVDDDYSTIPKRNWLVVNPLSETQQIPRADCEQLEGGLGI